MEAMLQGVAAQGRFQRLGAVITGYFAHPDQIALAARVIDQIRAVNPAARIVIDPVMGDEGKGLYVAQAVAEALMGELVPRADLLAPNAWELARISGREVGDAAGALAAARSLGRPVLVSSVRAGGQIGTAYVERAGAWLASHEASPAAPNGTGDLLTVLFAAAGLAGLPAPDALHAAVSGVAEAVAAAPRAAELSVADFPSRLDASPRVSLHAIDL
jgi:pyridoxine kinase